MSATTTNGHYTTQKALASKDLLHTSDDKGMLQKVTDGLPSWKEAQDSAEQYIRQHPKAAMLSGLGIGVLLAVLVRRLRG